MTVAAARFWMTWGSRLPICSAVYGALSAAASTSKPLTVNYEVLRRYKEAPILEPLSLPKMPACFPLNFPLSFPLTAFSEFYGILRASLESLENTTLFRHAFTPFYTPSLIQVPPRAPTGKPLKPQGFEGFFFSSKQFWPYWSTGGNRAPQTPDRCLSRRPLVSRQAGHGEMGAPSPFLRAIIAP